MSFKDVLNIINESTRDERAHYHITLCKLINILKDISPHAEVWLSLNGEPVIRVKFKNPHSYRGFYSDLAFETEFLDEDFKVSDLLKLCEECIDNAFEGYKGGKYLMDRNTPLWISERGSADKNAIVAYTIVYFTKESAGGPYGKQGIVLHTKYIDYDNE